MLGIGIYLRFLSLCHVFILLKMLTTGKILPGISEYIIPIMKLDKGSKETAWLVYEGRKNDQLDMTIAKYYFA